jgi:hypothetical protein
VSYNHGTSHPDEERPMSRVTLPALAALLGLAVPLAMAEPADAAKRAIVVRVDQIEAVLGDGAQTCTGTDSETNVGFTGTRTESRTLDFQFSCGPAFVGEQVTIEARCPEGYRSCTVHVSTTGTLLDTSTWQWTVWGPVEAPDSYVVLDLGHLRFSNYIHTDVRFV